MPVPYKPVMLAGRCFGLLALAVTSVLQVGCDRPRSYQYPPPPVPGPPAPVALAPSASDAPLPPPVGAGQVTAFPQGSDIRFRAGRALSAKLIAKDAEALALSPDGKSYVLLENNTARLVTPSHPAGYTVDAHAASGALFSADGSLVLVHSGAFSLLDVATGRVRLSVDTSSCAIGFSADGFIHWHEEAGAWNDWLGSAMRMSLQKGPPERVGPKRFVRECRISPDASSYVSLFPAPIALIDAKSGRSRVLVREPAGTTLVSPVADRVCVVEERGELNDLVCTRTTDGGVERVLVGGRYISVAFDPSGRRALLGSNRESVDGRNIERETFIADFQTRELRRIVGFEPKTGAIPTLAYGGKLLAQGSSTGMMVYDLERGEKRFISKARLYGVEPMAGHERRFFADAETFGGQDNAELYDVEWP
ncbi:MAG: hypothetical protein U0263_06480 [Polyangiaceae bacterium]